MHSCGPGVPGCAFSRHVSSILASCIHLFSSPSGRRNMMRLVLGLLGFMLDFSRGLACRDGRGGTWTKFLRADLFNRRSQDAAKLFFFSLLVSTEGAKTPPSCFSFLCLYSSHACLVFLPALVFFAGLAWSQRVLIPLCQTACQGRCHHR